MSTPQQPEIRRSGRTDVVQDNTGNLGGPTDEKGETGPVPPDNRPGHHPPVEQDKPTEVPEPYQAPSSRRSGPAGSDL